VEKNERKKRRENILGAQYYQEKLFIENFIYFIRNYSNKNKVLLAFSDYLCRFVQFSTLLDIFRPEL
jgi:hypothetical protein